MHDEITDHVEQRAELRHPATHDPLTGLAHRALLDERLVTALLPNERRQSSSVAVLLVDLDEFKATNDRDGHQVGDAVLAATARRLEAIGRAGDAVARWGGDEFLLLLPGCTSEAAQHLRARVETVLAEPVRLGALTVRASATVGVAVGARGDDVHELVLRADRALLAAKASRGDRAATHRRRSAGGTA